MKDPTDLPPAMHRYGDDYHRDTGNQEERVWRALGPDPLPDASHRLPPLQIPPAPPAAPAPQEARAFVIDIAGPIEAGRAAQAFSAQRRAAMGFPRLQGRSDASSHWSDIEETPPRARLESLALVWEMSSLLAEGSEAARELAMYTGTALQIAGTLGAPAAPRESPAQAAARATRLLRQRERFGRSIEMRLMATGRPFPARDVWRTAFSLGLEWGDMDLFHWRDRASGQLLFSVSATGRPGYFLPERAQEGEGIAGIALGFELPHSPAPVPIFERMALALAYFRECLGGQPLTRDGRELDAESLGDEREALCELVEEMRIAGMPAGSPEAARIF